MQAAFLIPAGIILYTVAGGLKATFIASCVHMVTICFFLILITERSKQVHVTLLLCRYVHTVIIYFALCIFSLTVYTSCPQLGSPGIVRPFFCGESESALRAAQLYAPVSVTHTTPP